MDSSSNHKACLLKIESPLSGWKKSLEKLLNNINDVSFMIDKERKTVYISGNINPQIILQKITKSGLKAIILWSDDNKQPENKKENLMEQSYMNAPPPPHAFSNYYYPPNYSWMNQPQPYYHHTFAPPPPYTRHQHPQPPAPPPYEYHQNEPVPKSFPPTPPPPKDFTMGDLQLGCSIM